MTVPKVSTLKVLCIDDSPVVLSGMTYMLAKTGFTKKNIVAVKTVKDAMNAAMDHKFDIYICDYNLGGTLNGKQVFEELMNKDLIKPSTIFVVISSESDAPTVKSILELNPDDYLLKPFNFVELKTRLLAVIKRKYTLLPIFEAEHEGNYEAGVPHCEELESFYPQYYFTIQRYKAKYLGHLKEYKKAESVYRNTLKQKNVDWAKLGLANTFVHTNREKEAFDLVHKMLKMSPSNAEAHIEMSGIHIKIDKLPKAIAHLQLANKLIPGNSERELVITNLCNAVGDYDSALEHYRVYVKINQNTFRNSVYTQFNLLRQLLYAAVYSKGKVKDSLVSEAQKCIKFISKEYDAENNYREQLRVCLAHLALVQRNLNDASVLLQEITRENSLKHYYDCYHFAWVLNEMSFYTEFDPIMDACMESMLGTLDTQGVHDIVESQMQMAKKLKAIKHRHTQQLVHDYKQASTQKQEGNMQGLLLTYIQMQKNYPYLGNVAFQIIQLLAQIWPSGLGTDQVTNLVTKSDFVVRELHRMDTETKKKYQLMVLGIKAQIKERREKEAK